MEHNNHGGGESLPPDPEAHERLQINTVVIPAAEEEPLRRSQLGASNLKEYQQLVGGLIQPVALEQPVMQLYCNEEGKLHDLPINRRATLLLWAHNPAFREQDLIVGDAFLVGQLDQRGLDTNVPDEFVSLLFEGSSLRVDIQQQGEQEWRQGRLRFDNWIEAYSYALTVTHGWSQPPNLRVVPDQ
jgi:hypothetical protein